MNPPKKEGFRYNAGTATSQDMQLALDKARTSAATTLAGLVESEWNGLVKRAQEETGLGPDSDIIDQFSNTQEQIISKQLNDLFISEQTVQDEKSDKGRIYRAYVLVEFNEGAANEQLLAQLRANEKIYNAIRATELFEDLTDCGTISSPEPLPSTHATCPTIEGIPISKLTNSISPSYFLLCILLYFYKWRL